MGAGVSLQPTGGHGGRRLIGGKVSGRKVGGHQHSAAFFELHIGTKHQAVTLRRVVLRCTSSSHQPLSRRPLLFRSSHPLGEPLN